MAEPGVIALLLAGGAAYSVGAARARRSAGSEPRQSIRAGCFAGALATLAVALLGPIADRAEHSLALHMVQHVLLLVVAAPLLAACRPLSVMGRTLPRRARALVAPLPRGFLRSHSHRWLAWTGASLAVASAVMVLWHAPVLYDAALHHEALHALEHTSFLLTATTFWWALGVGTTRPRGGAVAMAFLAALPGTALGATMTLARTPWYAGYPSTADQQLAGVVMWAFAGLAYVLVAAVLFGLWLAGVEQDTPGIPLSAVAEAVAVADRERTVEARGAP
ncbi:MAG: cytochrome c oxidase assembly protein [Actinomycetota bacterium]|nr:cytochrome c oxidase assembly protein [Actinomycetota bacterium]